MEKPDFSSMGNKDEVQQENYTAPWKREYKLSQDDIDTFKYCQGNEVFLQAYGSFYDASGAVKIKKADAKVGKTFTITGNYDTYNFYPLSGAILTQLKKYGF